MSNYNFEEMGLSPEIIRAVEEMGYTQPTTIQAEAIPLLMQGRDVIGRSSTGTGKTAAFGIPAVESIQDDCTRPQVLVLCPTRELAMQICGELKKYAKYKPQVRLAAIYGGQPMEGQIRLLRTANIVVGTPGRVMDHMRRHTLKLDQLKMVVLDEADEMLNMGFYEDIQTILTQVPEERQTVLFSATMPPAIMAITEEFQKDPEIVAVDRGQKTVDTIQQYYYFVPQVWKMDALNLLLQAHEPKRSVVFCNTRKMVDELVVYLNDHGFKSIGLHGDMKQTVRSHVMDGFKTGRISILVGTDVVARGIDVEDIDAVFNYDIPQDYEYYIHRIGRTGRAGKSGASYTLVCNRKQADTIRDLQRFLKVTITEKPLPSAEDILNKRMEKLGAKVSAALESGPDPRGEKLVNMLVEQGHEPTRIAAALAGLVASKDKRQVPVIQLEPYRRSTPSERGRAVSVRVNVGRNQQIAPNYLVGAIVDGTGLPAKAVGKIQIFGDHSTIGMSPEDAQLVMETMQNSRIKNNRVNFSITDEQPRPFYPDRRGGDSRGNYRGGQRGGRGYRDDRHRDNPRRRKPESY